MPLRFTVFLALALCPRVLLAQDAYPEAQVSDWEARAAGFTSDRPGFSSATGIAAQQRITTELGAAANFDQTSRDFSLPNLSIRTGVLDWLELRVRGPSAVFFFPDVGPDLAGLNDPFVGFKIGGVVHRTVAMSTVWEVSIPVGTDRFSANESNFFADFNLDWNFWAPMTLTFNSVLQIVSIPTTTGTARIFDGGASLAVSFQIIDAVGVFAQSYALASELSGPRVQIGGGVVVLPLPFWQLDVEFNAGVSDEGDPPQLLAGTTVLW